MSVRSQHGPGWIPLLDRVVKRLAELDPEGQVVAAKEKMGSMRIHVRSTATQRDLQSLYRWVEDESLSICEWCGEPGSMRVWGFRCSVRCDYCDDGIMLGVMQCK